MINSIINGKSEEVLKLLPSGSIDLVITSPPYNVDHKYDTYNDNLKEEEYFLFIKDVFLEIYRVLKDDGRICVNVPFAIKNMSTKRVSFLAPKITQILNEIGFNDFEMITWHKGKNINHFQGNNTAWGSWKSPSTPNFRPMGEAILVFYKKERSHKGNKENIDITGEEFKDWTKNSWYVENSDYYYDDIITVANTKKSADHPATFPTELVERLIKVYSYKEDVILDPFNGLGATTFCANKLSRKFVGIEISKKYCEVARSRIIEIKTNPWFYDGMTKDLVNKTINKKDLNYFFPYKESFNENLFNYLSKRYGIKGEISMLDPFVGTGSSFINNKVIKATGYDTSKFALDIAKSKLTHISNRIIENGIKFALNYEFDKNKKFDFPGWEPLSKYVDKELYFSLKDFVEQLKSSDEKLYNVSKMFLLSNLEKYFNYKRDGNGIKYRKNDLSKSEIIKIFRNDIVDFYRFLISKNPDIQKIDLDLINESSVNMKLTEKFDISFTSPPYLNMFDYYEVYKIELLLGGYINTREDWQQKRSISLRSNLNTKLLKSDKVNSSLLNNYLSKLTDEELASKTAIMINNYFFDMNEVLLKVLKHLKNGGYFFIVVGNSSYFNKPILVDEILAELGKEIGFEVVELIYSRKLNTSSQQMKNLKVIDKILLRETIIVLRKKYESKPKI